MNRKWNRLLGVLAGRRREQELSDELQSHIEMQTEDNLRAGMPPEEARRQARLKFGGLDSAAESYRDQRGLPWLETTIADLRYAARGLRKSPGFTIVAVLTLAIGIGANTAIFSLVNQLLLNPVGVSHPERVVALRTRYAKLNIDFTGSSSANLPDLRASKDVFEYSAIAGYGVLNYTAGSSVFPERLAAIPVSSEWFDVLGAKPLLGRVFTPQEDQPNLNRVVVLSHAAWTRLFGSDPSVIGRSVQFDQTPYQIIGVMKPGFRWPEQADLWTPLGLRPELYLPRNRFNEAYSLIARLKPGASIEQARAWLGVLTDRVRNAEKGGAYARSNDWSITVLPFTDSVAGDNKPALLLLLGSVGLVLVIACSNIAGLMISRTSVRFRELAIRAALGASRMRLFRQVLSEALLLAMAGGVAALGLAMGAIRLLLLLAPENAVAGLTATLDVYVLLFCAGASLASGLLFGLAPAWQVSRFDLQGAINIESRSVTLESGKQRLRSLLVIGETALALTLLIAAGLFIRSFVRLQSVHPGFEARGVMTAISTLPTARYPGGPAQASLYRTLLEHIRSSPGVTSAGLGWPLPMGPGGEAGSFQIEGRTVNPGDPPAHGERRYITPGYLEALSVPLRRGRYFADEDRLDTEMVAIIDDNLARQYWPGEDPVGKRLRMNQNDPWFTIVGVVGHVKHSSLALDSGKGVYYFTLFQRSVPYVAITVKTLQEPVSMVQVIRDAMRSSDPNQPVTGFRSMQNRIAHSLDTRRFGTRLLGFFGATALFLAVIGLYGVISYSVTQRTREIGIRMALGAERRSVMRLVVGQGLRLSIIGIAIGVGGAALLGQYFQSQLFQVKSFDPLTILATAAALLIAGLLASYLPARRAVRVDPAVTLRCD